MLDGVAAFVSLSVLAHSPAPGAPEQPSGPKGTVPSSQLSCRAIHVGPGVGVRVVSVLSTPLGFDLLF